MSTKFVIVGAPRTGSTLLVKTLNTLDGVRCHGELLGLDTVRGYEDGFDLANASKQARDDRSQRLLQARNQDPVGFIEQALERKRGGGRLQGAVQLVAGSALAGGGGVAAARIPR